MSGSAFGRVLVSSLVKVVFLTGSRHDIIFITLSIKELYLALVKFFLLHFPLQYVSVCICINKRGLMFALRSASIQCSSQFSYLTRNDFVVFSLFTGSTMGNRENYFIS